jgi:hypothetical protein
VSIRVFSLLKITNFTILAWGHAKLFAEAAAEIELVLEAGGAGDIFDAAFAGTQQFAGMPQADLAEIFVNGHTDRFAENGT